MRQLSSRRKKATCAEHIHEHQPCVVLKYNTITAENHPHRLDETPGGAIEIDEGREEKGRFWKSPFFHLFCKRTGKYHLAQAEKVYQSEAGSYQKYGKITFDDKILFSYNKYFPIHFKFKRLLEL